MNGKRDKRDMNPYEKEFGLKVSLRGGFTYTLLDLNDPHGKHHWRSRSQSWYSESVMMSGKPYACP